MKYRKKPVVIEAKQIEYDGRNALEVADWCSGDYSPAGPASPGAGVLINTLEGRMFAAPGDWVIEGVQGEFYPCKPDIFEATYDLV